MSNFTRLAVPAAIWTMCTAAWAQAHTTLGFFLSLIWAGVAVFYAFRAIEAARIEASGKDKPQAKMRAKEARSTSKVLFFAISAAFFLALGVFALQADNVILGFICFPVCVGLAMFYTLSAIYVAPIKASGKGKPKAEDKEVRKE